MFWSKETADQKTNSILFNWGIDPVKIARLHPSVWSADGTYVLKRGE
jgi:hypothetical protein